MNGPNLPRPETTKAALRQQFLARRKQLSLQEAEQRSQLITHQLFDYIERVTLSDRSGVVHVFLPIRRNNEVNTWPIIHRLWQQFPEVPIAVPVMNAATSQLSHYRLTSGSQLIENRLGIPEPVVTDEHAIAPDQIGMVIIPLITFDKRGNRVGYGGGYYDRFLAGCRPACLKIGVSLFEPVDQITDIELTDRRLTVCVTPTQIWHFDE